MTTPRFDTEGVFGDDYLYFFADDLEDGAELAMTHRRMIVVAGL